MTWRSPLLNGYVLLDHSEPVVQPCWLCGNRSVVKDLQDVQIVKMSTNSMKDVPEVDASKKVQEAVHRFKLYVK
ncbi:unnamed protein product, partial [Iphiclides podalirius]